MALKAIISNEELAALGEPLQAEYVERDGKYWLDVTPVGDVKLEDVGGLKRALSSERGKAKEFEKKIEALGDLDPDKAREALEKVEEMANWSPEGKVKEQLEAIKSQLSEKHKKELEKAIHDNGSLTAQIEKLLVDSVATQALTDPQIKGNVKLLLPHVRSQVKVLRGDDGNFVARVVDENGVVKLTNETGSTAPMSIKELVTAMRDTDEFAPGFGGSGASGSGAGGSTTKGGGRAMRRLTPEEASDPRKYQAAKEAAAKAGADIRDLLPMQEQGQ